MNTPGIDPRSRPLVSVVTPSFNYGRFVGRCMESVRSQTYPRIEHLVLDAGSTDASREVIGSFLASYDLRAWFEEDRGQADALNKGFGRARGDVLCWLNADDYWLDARVVERAVAALEAGADVVTASGVFVDEAGLVTGPFVVSPGVILDELAYYDTILQPATFWRRSVHRPLRAAMHYAFDWQLWLEMRRAGARFVALDEAWAAYRMHAVNKTAQDPATRKREIAAVLREERGLLSPQCLWAGAVFLAYALSERLGYPPLKVVAQRVNHRLMRATRRRVWSC